MQINLNRILNHNPILKLLLFVPIGISIGFTIPHQFLFPILIALSIFALIFLLFKQRMPSYIMITIAIGLILSVNFKHFKLLSTTDKFQEVKGKIYGEITEVFASEPDFASIRIVGTISLGNQTYNDVPVLLKIYSKKDTLRKFRANAKILAIASIRPPRRTNLPTDIAEIPLALSHEVLLFARTSNDLIIRFWESPVTAENIFARLREKLESNLNKMFSAEYFPYFDEMLLGNKQLLEGEQRDKFAITGISHLLSISGFHFGIVFAIVFALFSIFPNKWVRFVLLSLFMFFYLCIIDFPPSGIRAFIMIAAFLYANTLERKVSPYNVLAFIILVMLILKPSLLFSVGFQLSFLAVLGIIMFQKRIYTGLAKALPVRNAVTNFLLMLLSVTISAQLFVSPVVAYYFGYYTFISFFSNLVLVPIFSISLTFAFLAMLFSVATIEIGKIFAVPAEFLLSLGVKFNNILAEKLSPLVINNNGVVLLSILLSVLIIWILFAKTFKSFVFRFGALILLLIGFALNLNDGNGREIEIYPRAKYVALIFKNSGKNYCLLFDRKPHLFPSRDLAMEKYISRLNGDVILAVNGNVGIAISDQIKKQRMIRIVEVPSDVQFAISNALGKNQSIFKLGLSDDD